MGFIKNNIRRYGHQAVLKASAAETASATHAVVRAKGRSTTRVVVDVTAASGTSPTLTVVVEGSVDGGSSWTELGRIGSDGYAVGSVATAPAAITGITQAEGVFSALHTVRTRSVVGGTTPSFTYSVVAELA